jgi:hypothetical protein
MPVVPPWCRVERDWPGSREGRLAADRMDCRTRVVHRVICVVAEKRVSGGELARCANLAAAGRDDGRRDNSSWAVAWPDQGQELGISPGGGVERIAFLRVPDQLAYCPELAQIRNAAPRRFSAGDCVWTRDSCRQPSRYVLLSQHGTGMAPAIIVLSSQRRSPS